MTYQAKDYSHLKGIGKISGEAMQMHFKLYEGYVKNTNLIMQTFDIVESAIPEWNELHRRFGWEFNGMRLHELFFDCLTPALSDREGESAEVKGLVKEKIIENFGSLENWKQEFVNIAKMRGVGWAMMVQDLKTGKLINTWVNEHDVGMMADIKIILNIDMFEHAYVKDFGTDRAPYLDSIFAHIDWAVVSERLM